MDRKLALVAVLAVLTACAAPAAARDLSAVYPSEGAFAAALAPLREAAERNPRDAEARYRLGLAYFAVWRQYEVGLVAYGRDYHRVAEAEFRAALRASPGHLGSLLALYTLLRLRGDWSGAEALLAEVSRLTLPRGEVPAVR
ncbi:hypothetical protein HRbin31_00625 [bacterium HR31]|nr:hypothetical protein HRbin31_00625 [bacterium HR31]